VIEAARARWEAQQIHDYQFVYTQTGFNSILTGKVARVMVFGDTVRSATDTLTGDSIPFAGSLIPSVGALFDEAVGAAGDGSLTGIQFDPQLSYPTRLDIAGPPDASGSLFLSNLQPLLTATEP
jgi:hypothetical protein